MVQFYFLSIVLNALAGYILFKGNECGGSDVGSVVFNGRFSLKNETFRLIVGIVAALVGLMKLLSVTEGDVPVIGDIVPALAGILAGFVLIFEHYRSRISMESSSSAEKVDRLLVANKKIIGIAALAAAVLHFLFPRVLLL
ncbi:MAG: hypothetical protein FWD91_07725 [Treponema sp.]|nr:hypothetical protein [Treponema sp.]